MSQPTLVEQFRAALRTSTGLVGITTAEPAALIAVLRDVVVPPGTTKAEARAMVQHDTARGAVGLNEAGAAAITKIVEPDVPVADQTGNIVAMLAQFAPKLPAKTVLFVMNPQLYWENPVLVQAAWNLRDSFKATQRMCVFVFGDGNPQLPPVLQQDVIMLDDPAPTAAVLEKTILAQYESAKLPTPSAQSLAEAVDAVRGLPSLYTVEQISAMSLRKSGMDAEQLWERKIQSIETAPGLSVYRGGLTFADLAGLQALIEYAGLLLQGDDAPLLLLFLDEIEKSLGGAGTDGAGDSSGVTQDQLGVTLRTMQDNKWPGTLLLGPPGVSKTHFAKCCAGAAGRKRLMVSMDLGAMKGSYVGQSEGRIRAAFKMIWSMAGERVWVLATCNKLRVLPPEFKRRFKYGQWYVDLPDDHEKAAIWSLKLREFKLSLDMERPDDYLWTGSDIHNTCEIAWRLKVPLVKASKYIVPVAKSDPDAIKALRDLAHNRFLSASYEGHYNRFKAPGAPPDPDATPGSRKIELSDG